MNTFTLNTLLSMAIGALGAWAVCLYGKKAGMVDIPGERSSHARPTPRGGGVGIWIVAVSAMFILGKSPLSALFVFLIGALGLVEDIFSIAAKKRLLLQFVITLAAVFLFSGIERFTFLALALGLFWLFLIVWTTNLYNFMDGVDGIAGITAITVFSLLGYAAFSFVDSPSIGYTCLAIAAANLGFLFFNFPKAKVFMGDVGSLSLGFVFAFMVMLFTRSLLDLLCFLALLFPFYADELVTMFLRIKRGENLLKAHRSHFYQILANEISMAHWKVSVLYGLSQLFVGISVLFLRRYGVIIVLPVLILYFTGFVCVNCYVRKIAVNS